MTLIEVIFWLSLVCVLYTYMGYPVMLAAATRLRAAREFSCVAVSDVPVSAVLAAHNEEIRIAARIRELVQLVAARPAGGEVVVVSDGSTDRTAARALVAANEAESATGGRVPVRVLVQEANLGKAMALNHAHAVARSPILVFADARQTWAPDAINRLVAAFGDPTVGAVSGELLIESSAGVMAGVGLYWRFEKWLRRTESRLDSMVSVTGSISAVRRELFPTLPIGTVLDDVYWPLGVAMGGHRVIHIAQAVAFDRLPERTRDEFRRKVRTLAGNFQLMTLMPAVLLPSRNRLWWQFVSHRALRLVVPWALLVCLVTAAVTPGQLYSLALWSQVTFYLLGLVGFWSTIAKRSRLAAGMASFVVLNAAAWFAFWVWAFGRSSRTWTKARYRVGEMPAEVN